ESNQSRNNRRDVAFRESRDVAVTAMAGRFPGADTVEELWENLKLGKEGIHLFPDGDLDISITPALSTNPNYVKARGVIKDADKFDPAFFNLNLRTAELMDPQQRIFLEICWESMVMSGSLKISENSYVVFFG